MKVRSSTSDTLAVSEWPIRRWGLSRLFMAWATLVVLGLAVGFLLVHTPIGDPIESIDVEASQWFESTRTAEMNQYSNLASEFGGTVPIVVAVAVGAVLLALMFRRWREPVSLMFALGLEATVFITVSTLVGRDRPPVEQLDPSPPTASFPSGHTGAATAMYATLAAIVWWRTDNPVARMLAAVVAVALAAGVALSRLYRGMHFITDVTFGMLLGGAAAYAAIVIVERAIERRRGS